MSDLIERQDAIDALTHKWDGMVTSVFDVLKELPSEDHKTGEWIIDGEFIDCSVCRREKWSRVPYEGLVKRFRYCPNCGAKMVGDS